MNCSSLLNSMLSPVSPAQDRWNRQTTCRLSQEHGQLLKESFHANHIMSTPYYREDIISSEVSDSKLHLLRVTSFYKGNQISVHFKPCEIKNWGHSYHRRPPWRQMNCIRDTEIWNTFQGSKYILLHYITPMLGVHSTLLKQNWPGQRTGFQETGRDCTLFRQMAHIGLQ